MWTGETVARAACFYVRKGERERICQCGRVIRGDSAHATRLANVGESIWPEPTVVGFLPHIKESLKCIAFSVEDRGRCYTFLKSSMSRIFMILKYIYGSPYEIREG